MACDISMSTSFSFCPFPCLFFQFFYLFAFAPPPSLSLRVHRMNDPAAGGPDSGRRRGASLLNHEMAEEKQ